MKAVLREARARFRYNVLPRLVDWCVVAVTWEGRKKIARIGAQRLLVDNSVLGHAIAHESAWISTGKASLVPGVEMETGFAARIAVHSEDDSSSVARSDRYLPAIASLARRGHITLLTSPELMDERLTKPIGLFAGYGAYDHNLFWGIQLKQLPDATYKMMLSAFDRGKPSLIEQRRYRMSSKPDPLYRKLVQALGEANNSDAYHIAFAESHSCYCFLTMDFSLIRNVRAQSRHPAIASLRTRILSPEEFGQSMSLRPIPPRLYSYHAASFPVRPEMNWPDSRRRTRRKK